MVEFGMVQCDPHPKLDVFELLSARRPRHGLGMGPVCAACMYLY